ncbi:MAG: TolC family protein [Bacteroidota bacterium]
MKQNKFNIFILLISALVFLGSCKVTQPYQHSQTVSSSLFRDVNTADTNSIAQVPWQQIFTDTLLQSLIAEGIKNNFDIKIAQARIKQAEANFTQSREAFFPAINGNASAGFYNPSSSQSSGTQINQLYADASWQLDIWGKLKSAKRGAYASLLQSDAYKRAVQTQLISGIAGNYYALLAYDEELKITLQTVENRKQDVETMKILKNSDVVTGAAVVQSAANLYSAQVTIPDIQQNIRQTENALCVLSGRNPGSILRDSLWNQHIAVDVNTGIPAQLLANRPDVQEAEFQVRNAFETVNAARTYFYPSINITGEAGLYSTSISNFFNPASFFANIIGGLTQPIFNNGTNTQRLKVSQAQLEEYEITFKKTLLTAGQEVSDALYQYKAANDKTSIRALEISNLEKAVDYTKELLKYTSATNYTDVLTSEQGLLAARLNAVSDKLQLLQGIVTLYAALGGGWK